MQREGYGFFGASTNNVVVNVTEPVNNAQPVSQTVLTQVEAGKTYTVSVTMVNNGETTWTRAQNYLLMSRYPWNDMSWGLNRVALPFDPVGPGQTATFIFQITAPTTPGSYPFQWGMLREGIAVFGPGTNLEMANVVAPPPLVNNAQVVGMTAPNRMITGQHYDVAVTMRNTGTTTWAPGSKQLLGSQNPQDNGIWGMSRVPLPAAVAPGQQYSFVFQVTAPAPGDYNMQWRMLQEAVEWFGATAGSPVTVTENLGNVTFIHTDGLGSPVARTDATGNVVSRTRYEPYGYTASGATPTIGFTGHVNDADTGLTYMQQRYYDPVAGRFLSIDPVVTDANTGESFNRYKYAENNPYKFTDPDGRMSASICAEMVGNCTSVGSDSSGERSGNSCRMAKWLGSETLIISILTSGVDGGTWLRLRQEQQKCSQVMGQVALRFATENKLEEPDVKAIDYYPFSGGEFRCCVVSANFSTEYRRYFRGCKAPTAQRIGITLVQAPA